MYGRGTILLAILVVLASWACFRGGIALRVPASIETTCLDSDSESLLVCGRPLRLRDVDAAQLELIPGMTPRLADAIQRAAAEIADEGRSGKSTAEALQVVPGIGPKRAAQFSGFLSLE